MYDYFFMKKNILACCKYVIPIQKYNMAILIIPVQLCKEIVSCQDWYSMKNDEICFNDHHIGTGKHQLNKNRMMDYYMCSTVTCLNYSWIVQIAVSNGPDESVGEKKVGNALYPITYLCDVYSL
jgi:hypothetical protein